MLVLTNIYMNRHMKVLSVSFFYEMFTNILYFTDIKYIVNPVPLLIRSSRIDNNHKSSPWLHLNVCFSQGGLFQQCLAESPVCAIRYQGSAGIVRDK